MTITHESFIHDRIKEQIKFRECLLPFSSESFVLCGCETWSNALREEYRLQVFENRVLRRMFGPNREEVVGCWRRLHNKDVHNLYS
jgi:hypothetical protein